VVWGVRLSVHLHRRNHRLPEDPRYVQLVERAGPRIFVTVYLVQAVVLWFVSRPVQVVWWGLVLIGCSGWLGVATMLLPIVMTYPPAKGTGKPLLERGLRKSLGYGYYAERTSGFFPLPPKKAVTRP
jgi:steroid 5-alpha reductase family enzyme